jgi:hypothetical protein
MMSYKSEPRFYVLDISIYMFLGNRNIGVTSDIFRINLGSVLLEPWGLYKAQPQYPPSAQQYLLLSIRSPNWSIRLWNCRLPHHISFIRGLGRKDGRGGIACGVQDGVVTVVHQNVTSQDAWFLLVIIVHCHTRPYTTPRRRIDYHVKVSSLEMQRGHVDDGKLECHNFSTWKQSMISRLHEVNHHPWSFKALTGSS